MKIYASSYRIGSDRELFGALVSGVGRIAVVTNALDFSVDHERRRIGLERELSELREFGVNPEELDLRRYFSARGALKAYLDGVDAVWVIGGNAFVLGRALRYSGMDEILRGLRNGGRHFLYAGYSAGACVLAPTLAGIDRVDSPDVVPSGYSPEIVWEGLGLIGMSLAPHYRSDHPDSERIEAVVEYFEENDLPFRALRDGEVMIVDAVEPEEPEP